MKIVADKNIPFALEAFSSLGEVVLESGSEINADTLSDADALITRTTTRVTPDLLDGSSVKFVGTATAGTDHIDISYLERRGIGFASAAGCNSRAVGEFVLNALIRLASEKPFRLAGKVLGIIGAGNAGQALKTVAEAYGLKCLLNDPPLFEATGHSEYISLHDLIDQSDILSLHVPLTMTGPHATRHLLSESCFERCRQGVIIVNTARGGVIDEKALGFASDKRGGLILDVWENEPDISMESLHMADIATPHVAGYSLEGKVNATMIIHQQLCRFLDIDATWHSPISGGTEINTIEMKPDAFRFEDVMCQVYDIFKDDAALREISGCENPAAHFRSLRSHYHFRREFSAFMLSDDSGLSSGERYVLKSLGFQFPSTQ